MAFREARYILLISLTLLLLSLSAVFYIHSKALENGPENGRLRRIDIQIEGYSPKENDEYVVISRKVEPSYIVKFEPLANVERVHHMLLYGCENPAEEGRDQWIGGLTCSGKSYLIWQWARNGEAFDLPHDVGFSVGNDGDNIHYLVLQIHYVWPFVGNVRDFSGVSVYLANKRPKYVAGVYMFVSYPPIPPRMPAFFSNVSCTYDYGVALHPFAFRVHTHPLGRLVSAYVRHASSGKWSKIGKRNPQWPQNFQPTPRGITIRKGDLLAGMCRFDTRDRDVTVPVGAMGADEMCVFYIVYYREADSEEPFNNTGFGAGCFAQSHYTPPLALEYPLEGTTLLPSHPELEAMAQQATKPFGVVEKRKLNAIGGQQMGSVVGLSFDPSANLVVFHRADRKWKIGSAFDANNVLIHQSPIEAPVILVVSTSDYQLLAKYGSKKFYLPHGIFVDSNGNYFTTDAGSHQVVKWSIANGELSKVWEFGEKFVPGSDSFHLCQPTAVAVSRLSGKIFIADGHCNSRVIKLTRDGTFDAQWRIGESSALQRGIGYTAAIAHRLSLPHDISFDDAHRRIYVADKENSQLHIFNENGEAVEEIRHPHLYTRVQSAHSSNAHGLFFIAGLSGDVKGNETADAYVVPLHSPTIQYAFRPPSRTFKQPHILRTRNKDVWVGELESDESGSGTLWHLQIETESLAASTSMVKDDFIEAPNPNTILGTGALIFAALFLVALAIGYVGSHYCYRRRFLSTSTKDSPESKPLNLTGFGLVSSSEEED